MGEATFTFRVDEELKASFTQAAKATDHNAAQLLRQFMRDFVREQEAKAAEEAWIEREIADGLREADATPEADWVSHEVVKEEMARERAELLKLIAERKR
jgi:predicted transcriptional regulator